jgi:hypothetical protein|tara:strand:- start:107 stop:742 length:636 start_codon:yes stop_codon:yes gene_type:complete
VQAVQVPVLEAAMARQERPRQVLPQPVHLVAVVAVVMPTNLAASADLVAVLVATALVELKLAGQAIRGVILRLKVFLVALRMLIKGVAVVVVVKLEHRGQRRRAIVADLGVVDYRMLMMGQIITMLAVAAAGRILDRVVTILILREEEVMVVVVLVANSLAVQLPVVAQEEMLAGYRGQAKGAMVVQILVVVVVVKLLEVRAAVPVVLVLS